ncbi:hypothetical protein AK830_g10537 [Neonectria ditissima]|uniref:Uncharacterized protein n=1 Tax=Neonectria ditissima TaxID=78410 RepID=A0A0P7ATB8_9HYPO|nr:hypothetical protein AK830_g10537 [Neonectria ditissima]
MEVQTLLVATCAAATWAAAPDDEMNPAKICGRLGVMKVDPEDLPGGVKMEDVRMCAGHPLGAENFWGYGDYLPAWLPF